MYGNVLCHSITDVRECTESLQRLRISAQGFEIILFVKILLSISCNVRWSVYLVSSIEYLYTVHPTASANVYLNTNSAPSFVQFVQS